MDKKTKPSEQCPNCRQWYDVGQCCHTAQIKGAGGLSYTLYGVCSFCASNFKNSGIEGLTGDELND